MRLSVKALALTVGILWAAAMFLATLTHLIRPGYAQQFLQVMASIYPGYHAGRMFGDVAVGTLYAFVDGAVCGAVLAWLYNRFAGSGPAG